MFPLRLMLCQHLNQLTHMFSDYLNEANTLVCQVLPEHVRFAGFVGDFSWMKRGLRDHRFWGLVRKVRVRRPILVSHATKPADVTHSLHALQIGRPSGVHVCVCFCGGSCGGRCCVHVRWWWWLSRVHVWWRWRVRVRVYPVVVRLSAWCVRALCSLWWLLAGGGLFCLLYLFLKFGDLFSQFCNLVFVYSIYVHGLLCVTVSPI